MMIGRRELMGAGVGLAVAAPALAQSDPPPSPAAGDPAAPQWPAAERFPLWPEGRIPGTPARLPVPDWTMNGAAGSRQLWVRGVAVPEVSVFRPTQPDGTAILAIPGGGYEFLSVQNEGLEVARRFTASRTTVFVLTYRLPAEGWLDRGEVPLQDAQRAMRLIRAHAPRYSIDPLKFGIVGFSAGGHLAADLATQAERATYRPVDAIDSLSARPVFAGLIYPVASLDPAITHPGSLHHLLGPDPSPATIRDRSPVAHVLPDTSPLFLLHAIDDDLVPVANSLAMMEAARAARVPVEAHFLEHGGHGFGLRLPASNPGALWPDLFDRWFRSHV